MGRLLIIDNIWSPYAHARYTAIAQHSPHHLTVFFQSSRSAHRVWDADGREPAQYSLHFLKTLSLSLSSSVAYDLNINYDAYTQIRNARPDRIVVCGWDSPATLMAMLYAKRHRKEVFLWAGSTEHEPSWVRTLTLPYVRFLLRHFDGFISYGTAATDYLRKLGVTKLIEPFYNTVDIDFFRQNSQVPAGEEVRLRTKYGLRSDSRLVLYVGRLVNIKRLDLLIKAFSRVQGDFPHWELVLAGYGPEESSLKQLANENPKIHFLGPRNVNELAPLYGMSAIFVLPSAQEPWGLVVNEAMAARCAVLVSDHCGCARDLVDGNGFVFPSGNADELFNMLRTMMEDSPRLEVMRRRSATIIGDYTPDKLVQNVTAFMK